MFDHRRRGLAEGARPRRGARSDLGSALLVVMAAAAILFVIAASVIGVVVFQQTQQSHAQAVARSTGLAQQGMEAYLTALRSDADYYKANPRIQGAGRDGTWTVVATAAVGPVKVTSVGRDRASGLMHVIVAELTKDSFGDYTIVSGGNLDLGNASASNVIVKGNVLANGSINLRQRFTGMNAYCGLGGGVINEDNADTVGRVAPVDLVALEGDFPSLYNAAKSRERWGAPLLTNDVGISSLERSLAFYRDPNNASLNYWGADPSHLSPAGIGNEPDLVGVGIDFANATDPGTGQFYVRSVWPPTNYNKAAGATRQDLLDLARKDPTWNIGNLNSRWYTDPLTGRERSYQITPRGLSPDGNNVIYVGGNLDVYIKGTYSRSVTIVSEGDIYIIGDVTRAADSSATLGLVAKHDVIICGDMPTNPGGANTFTLSNGMELSYTRGGGARMKGEVLPDNQDLKIEAAVMAVTGSIRMDPSDTEELSSLPARRRGTLRITGSLIANGGLTGTNFANRYNDSYCGYRNTVISFDPRLQDSPPPLFPQIGTGTMRVIRWDEYTTTVDPNAGLYFPPAVHDDSTPVPDDGTELVVLEDTGDRTPPVTTANRMPVYYGQAVITLETKDAGVGVWRTWYTIDNRLTNGEPTVFACDTSERGVGTVEIASLAPNTVDTRTVKYWSRDLAGNWEDTQTITFKMIGRDTDPPATTVIDSLNPSKKLQDGYPDKQSDPPDSDYIVYGDFRPDFYSVDTTNGLGSYWIWVEMDNDPATAQKWDRAAEGLPLHMTVPYPPAGFVTHEFKYYGIDQAGNREPERTLTIRQHAPDMVAPRTFHDIESPTVGDAVIHLTGIDDDQGQGWKDTWYQIDEGQWKQSLSNPTMLTVKAPGRGSPGVSHTVRFYSRDLSPAVNREETQTVDLLVLPPAADDITPPVTSSDATSTYIGPAVINLSSYDAGGVAAVYYSLDGAAYQTGTRIEVRDPLSGKAVHSISYFAVDSSDNTETAKYERFLVLPEDIAPITAAHNLPLYKGPAEFQFTAEDNVGGSGLAWTKYKIDDGPIQSNVPTDGLSWGRVTAEGAHIVSYWSVDRAGNVETTKTTPLRVDTTPPHTTTDNTGAYEGEGVVTLTATDEGGSGVKAIRWRNEAFGFEQVTNPVRLGLGHSKIDYWSVDEAGNVEAFHTFEATVTAGEDHTAPASYDDVTPYYNRSVSPAIINLYSWDVQSGVKTMHLLLDGVGKQFAGKGSPPESYQFTVSGDATHTIEYWADDKAGNVEAPHTVRSFKIDTVFPVTLIDAHPGGSYWDTQQFSLTASDAGSGVKATYYSLDGAATVKGVSVYVPAPTDGYSHQHVIQYWSVDKAGNVEYPAKTVSFVMRRADHVPPMTFASVIATSADSVTVLLSAFDNLGGSGVEQTHYSIDSSGTTDGTLLTIRGLGSHTLEYWSTDKAGNTEQRNILEFNFDATPPLTVSDVVAAYNTTATIHLTPNDNPGGSGVATTMYRVDGGSTVIGSAPVITLKVGGEGSHTLEYWSIDYADNEETPHVKKTFVIDLTPPKTTSDAVGSYAGTATINLSADDGTGTGIAYTYYKVDAGASRVGAQITVPMPLVGYSESHTVRFWSEDNAGNVESMTANTVNFTVTVVANMTFSNWAPPKSSTQGARNPTVTVTATSDRDVATATALFDGIPVTGSNGIGPVALTWLPADMTPSGGSISISAGAAWTKTPTVTLALSAVGVGGSTVTLMRLSNDNSTWGAWEAYATSRSYSLPAGDGPKTVYVQYKDAAGNVGSTCFDDIGLDGSAPVTTCNAQANGVYNGTQNFTLSPVDTGGSGWASTSWQLDGTTGAWTSGTTVQITSSITPTHTIYWYSTDAAGNSETQKSVVGVSVRTDDTTPPSGLVTINAGATWTKTTAVTLALSATDMGGSGMSQMRFSSDAGSTWSAWETFATSKSHTLPSGDGAKRVSVQFKDASGNISGNAFDDIGLDGTAPYTTINAGSGATYYGTQIFTLSPADNGSGVTITQHKVDSGSFASGTSVTVAAPASGTAAHTITWTSTDAAGNGQTGSIGFTLSAPVSGGTGTTGSTALSLDVPWYDATIASYSPWGSYSIYANGVLIGTKPADGSTTWNCPQTTVPSGARIDIVSSVGWGYLDGTQDYNTPVTNTLFLPSGTTRLNAATWSGFKGYGYIDHDHWYDYDPECYSGVWLDATSITGIAYTLNGGDGTAPTGLLAINAGAATTKSTSVSLTLSASETGGSGMGQMRFSNDYNTWSVWETYATSKAWTLAPGDGNKFVYAQLKDAAGNTTAYCYDIIALDATAPYTTCSANAAGTYSGAQTFALTSTDGLTGVAGTEWQLDSTAGSWTSGASVQVAAPSSGTASHTIYWRSTDLAGNVETAKSVVISVSAPVAGGGVSTASTTFTLPDYAWYDAYLDSSGQWGSYSIYANGVLIGTKVADGNPTWNCPQTTVPSGAQISIVRDCGFNSLYGTWDDNVPYADSFNLPANVTQLNAATWSGFIDYRSEVSWYDDYESDYVYVCLDPTTITGISYSTGVIDTTLPSGSVAVNAGAAWTKTTDVPLTLSASDVGGSGLSQMRFSNDNSAWSAWETYASSKPSWSLASGNGTKTVYVQFKDGSGNVSTSASDAIVLDGIAPTGICSAVSGTTYTGSMTFALTPADTGGSGLASTKWTLDSGALMTGTSVMVPSPASGTVSHTISWYSTDQAGNTQGAQSVTFNVAAPASTGLNKKVATASFPTYGLTNGAHTVAVTFTTEQGASKTETWNFTVNAPADIMAPLTTSDAMSIYSAPATITLTAADEPTGTGVASTVYRLDGAQQTGTAPITKVRVATEGPHTLEYWSTDKAGNREQTRSVSFVLDWTPPTTTAYKSNLYRGVASIYLSAVDNPGGSGVNSTFYSVDSGPSNQVSPSTVDSNVVGLWHLDETAGTTAADSSAIGNAATLYGGATWMPGRFGSSLGLSTASSQYAQTATNSPAYDVGGAITLECWFKTTTVQTGKFLVMHDDAATGTYKYGLYLTNGSKDLSVYVRTATGATSVQTSLASGYNDGKWHYVAGTYDKSLPSSRLKLFVDGVQVGQKDWSPEDILAGAGNMKIGRWGSAYFDGQIDEVRVSNVARSAAYIQSNYTAAAVAQWRFDEGFGTTVADSSGSGYTGTINVGSGGSQTTAGQAWVNGVSGRFGKSLKFDGVDDYVNVGSRPGLNNPGSSFSVSAWVKTSQNTGIQTIASRGDDWRLQKSGGSYQFVLGNSAGQWVQPYLYNATTDWTYVVGTFEAATGQVKLYLNGMLAASGIQTGTARTTQTQTQIGNAYTWHTDGTYNDYWFNGQIDDVSISSSARSDIEIMNAYGSAKAGQWHFDEATGTALADVGGNGYSGTLVVGSSGSQTAPAQAWANGAAGKFGAALNFDGIDDYVNLGSQANLNNLGPAFSVGAWVKTASTSGQHMIAGRQNDWRLQYKDGSYQFEHRNTNNVIVTASAAYSSADWVYVVGTFDSSTGRVRLYINGALVSDLPQTGTTRIGQTANEIGANNAWHDGNIYSNDYFWSGQIDEVTFSNIARSPEDVQSYYDASGSGATPPVLVTIAPPLTDTTVDHTVEYRSVDNAGNNETTKSVTIRVTTAPDTTPPTTTSDATTSYIKPSTITLFPQDNYGGRGIAATYWRLDGGLITTGTAAPTGGKGAHTLEFWSVDAASPANKETTKTAAYTVKEDLTAPRTTSNAIGSYDGTAAIALDATDTVDGVEGWGVQYTFFTVDDGAQTTGTAITVAPPITADPFPHHIDFWSTDYAGNVEPAKTASFTVAGAVVDINWSGWVPAEAPAWSRLSNPVVSITGQAASRIATTGATIKVDGIVYTPTMTWSADHQTATATISAAGLFGGPHNVTATFNLANGNRAKKTWTFYTDILAPNTYSDCKDSYNGTATIGLTAYEDFGGSGVYATYYRVDGHGDYSAMTTPMATASGTAWNISWSGGTAPYSVVASGLATITSATSPCSFAPATAGVYWVYVRDSAGMRTVAIPVSKAPADKSGTGGVVTVPTFTASGSWTVPSGVTQITVDARGAGGGGGGQDNDYNADNGASGDRVVSPVNVTAGEQLTVTVGSGGVGGGTSGNRGYYNEQAGSDGGVGYNNGFSGGNGEGDVDSGQWAYGGSGGGASSGLRRSATRLVEAAGGAGGRSSDYWSDWDDYDYAGGYGGAGGGSNYPAVTTYGGGGSGGAVSMGTGGSGSVSITYGTPAVSYPSSVTATWDGTGYRINWTGGTAPYSVIRDGVVLQANATSGYVFVAGSAGSYVLSIRDSLGNESNGATIWHSTDRNASLTSGQASIGTTVTVAPPAYNPASHVLEYWSVDKAGNVEQTRTVSFTVKRSLNNGTKTWTATGQDQTFTVPANITTISVDVGGGAGSASGSGAGGIGGRITAILNVTPGQVLTLRVGGKAVGFTGGWPNGAAGGTGAYPYGAGGGSTAVINAFTGSALPIPPLTTQKILLEAGGGGGGDSRSGAAGGNGSAVGTGVQGAGVGNQPGTRVDAGMGYGAGGGGGWNGGVGGAYKISGGAGGTSMIATTTVSSAYGVCPTAADGYATITWSEGADDNIPPVGTMSINNGAAYATTRTATIDSNVTDTKSGLTSMTVDPAGTGAYGPWIGYTSTYPATLTAGDGLKKVFAQYRDFAGNILELSDTILLDTLAPTTQSNAALSYSGPANISLSATDTYPATGAGSGVAWTRYTIDDGTEWVYSNTTITVAPPLIGSSAIPEVGGSLLGGGYESGANGAAIGSPWTSGTGGTATYTNASPAVGSLAAQLNMSANASATALPVMTETSSSGMTADGAEYRFWYNPPNSASHFAYITDNAWPNPAWMVTIAPGTGGALINTSRTATGYAPGFTAVASPPAGWLEWKVVLNFTTQTYQLSYRASTAGAWIPCKSATAPDYNIPFSTTGAVTRTSGFAVYNNGRDSVNYFDNVQYSRDGIIDLPSGVVHHIDFWSRDNAGLTETMHTATFTVNAVEDRVAPETIATPTVASWYSTAVAAATRISLVATDYPRPGAWGVAHTYYTFDSGSRIESTTIPLSSAAGAHSFQYWSVDAAANKETTRSAGYSVDATAPVTTSNAAGPYVGTTWITLYPTDINGSGVKGTGYRLDDSGSYLSGTTVQVSATASGTVTHHIDFYSTDMVNNTETVKATSNFTVQAPTDTGYPWWGWGSGGGGGGGGSGGGYGGSSGTNQLQRWYNASQVPATVQITAIDSGWGVRNIAYKVTNDLAPATGTTVTVNGASLTFSTGTTEGDYHVSVAVTDWYGNVTTGSAPFGIDKHAPTTSSDAVAAYPGVADISLTATDGTGPGVSGVNTASYPEYRVDNGAWTFGSQIHVAGPAVDTATHTVDFRSGDVAGNLEVYKSRTFSITSLEAPLTFSLTPTANATVTTRSPEVAADALSSGPVITAATATFDGSPVTLSYQGFNTIAAKASFRPTNLADGLHTVSMTFSVATGAKKSVTWNFYVTGPDNQKPTTTWTYTPASGYGTATVTLSASDNTGGSGLQWTRYKLDGGAWVYNYTTAQTLTTTFAVAPPAPRFAAGHNLSFQSSDKLSNLEDEHPVSLTVYPPADSIAPTSTSDAATTFTGTAHINLSAYDNPGGWGVRWIKYTIDDGSLVTASGSSAALTIFAPVMASQVHHIDFWAADWFPVPNEESPHNRVEFTVNAYPDNTPPVTTPTYQPFYPRPATIALTANDGIGWGVDKTYYSVDGTAWTTGNSVPTGGSGEHHLDFYSTDLAGQKESTKTITYNVDMTAPTTTSDAGATYDGTATITLESTDTYPSPIGVGSGVAYSRYSIDDGAVATGTVIKVPAPQYESQVRHIDFWSVDRMGNIEETRTATFIVHALADHTPPVTTHSAVPLYSTVATFTLTPRDDGWGVAETYWNRDTTSWTTGTSVGTGGEGNHKVEFYSVDRAGNKEETKSVTYLVDLTAPTTKSNAGKVYAGSAAISLSATDGLVCSGVKETRYKIDGGTSTLGTSISIAGPTKGSPVLHRIEFWSVDFALHTEVSTIETFTISPPNENTPPVTTATVSPFYPGPSTIALVATDIGWGVDKTYYSVDDAAWSTGNTVLTGGSGQHHLDFYSVDLAGNKEEAKTVNYNVDMTPPMTTSNNAGSYTGTATITLTATDDYALPIGIGSGVLTTYYRIDDGTEYAGTVIKVAPPVFDSAKHHIDFYSVDKMNRPESPAVTASFTINAANDTTAPTTTSNHLATYSEPGTFTLTAVENAGGWGVTKISYSLDGSPTVLGYNLDAGGIMAASCQVGTRGGGSHTLQFWATDKKGNKEDTRTITYDVTPDNTPPVTTWSPNQSYFAASAAIRLQATDVGWGVDYTKFQLNGGPITTGTDIFVSAPTTGSVNTTITFWSVDKAGNQESAKTATFTVGSTPANITFPSWTPTTTVTTSTVIVSVKAISGDASTLIDTITATFDNGVRVVTNTKASDSKSATSTFTVTGLVSGTHNVVFTATDSTGHQVTKNWSFVAAIQTDFAKPVTWSNNIGSYYGTATVTLTATDTPSGSGVKATYFKVNGAAQTTGTVITILPPAAGGSISATITYWSVDNAGNTEDQHNEPLTVFAKDDIAPTTHSDAKVAYPAPSTIRLEAQDNDGGSGVAATYYRLDGADRVEGTLIGTGGMGTHVLEFWSVDKVGNIEKPTTVSYKVDTTAPLTTSDAKSEYEGQAEIVLHAQDEPGGSGVKYTYYMVDSGVQRSGKYVSITPPVFASVVHSIYFWSVDEAGNVEATRSATFTVKAVADKTAPTTTSDARSAYPVPGLIKLVGADIGGWGVSATYYKRDNEATATGTAVRTGDPGTHTLRFWSVDRADNVEKPNTATYTVGAWDTQKPTTWLVGALSAYTGEAKISLEASDNCGVVPATYYRIDNGPDVMGNLAVIAPPRIGTASHTLYFWSTDINGNVELTKHKDFTVTVPPATMTFSGMTPLEGSTALVRNPTIYIAAVDTQTITGAVIDVDGQVRPVTFMPNGTLASASASAYGLDDGLHWVTATFINTLGATANKSWSFTVAAPQDVTAPHTVSDAVAAYPGTARVTLTATDDDGGRGVRYLYYTLDGGTPLTGSLPDTVLTVATAGPHRIEYWSEDLAFNTEWPRNVATFTVDVVPPTTSADARMTYETPSAEITLTASDDPAGGPVGSGVAATYYSLDSTATVLTGTHVSVQAPASGEGVWHTLYYWSVDKAGNIEPQKDWTFRSFPVEDLTPPDTTSTVAASYAVPSAIRLIAHDAGWGVLATHYSLDLGPDTIGTIVGTGGPGTHTLVFWSVDTALNEEVHHSVSYTVGGNDTAKPHTTSNAAATYTEGVGAISLTATDGVGADVSGVAHTYYTWDDGQPVESTMIGVSGAGQHHVDFWSVDWAGNKEDTQTATFVVTQPDLTPPHTTSDAVESYLGTAIVTLYPTDGGSGVQATFHRIDSGVAVMGPTITIAPPVGVQVEHTITFWSVDRSGNVEVEQTVRIWSWPATDTLPPTTSVLNGAASYTGTATISLVASDNVGGSGYSHTHYTVDDGLEATGTTIVVGPPATGTASHHIDFYSVDAAGNIEQPASTFSFTVSAVPMGTLSFRPAFTSGHADLHVTDASGQTLFTKSVSGTVASALAWDVKVPAGPTYYMWCDHYQDDTTGQVLSTPKSYLTPSVVLNQSYFWTY